MVNLLFGSKLCLVSREYAAHNIGPLSAMSFKVSAIMVSSPPSYVGCTPYGNPPQKHKCRHQMSAGHTLLLPGTSRSLFYPIPSGPSCPASPNHNKVSLFQNNVGCCCASFIRFSAIAKYSSLISMPIKFLFVFTQATPILPLPIVLSSTVSPSLE